MAKILLNSLAKKFDQIEAVRDIDLEIADKEFVVLVGPSGCGKTTVLRLIAGLESPTKGEIIIDDTKVNDLTPKDRDVAMVFQNYALFPHLNVYDNMAFGLKLRKLPRQDIDQRVRNSAKLLGITELLDRKPGQLSGGQRQRVAVGRAIARKPKVYLFDEPLSNLDAKMRVQMRAEFVKLHERTETTFVYVTHDQIEAMTLADRIVVMKDGRVQQVGEPFELFEKPINMFVAEFIGSPSMNFLECKVVQENSGFYLKFMGRVWLPNLRIPGTFQYVDALDEHLQAAITGQVSPKNALARCAQDWEDITMQLGKEQQLQYFKEDVGYSK